MREQKPDENRKQAPRETVESCRALDVRELQRAGMLRPWGRPGQLPWHTAPRLEGDGHLDLMMVQPEEKAVSLLSFATLAGDRRLVTEAGRLIWTRCNYGVRRPWFLCPGCDRRAAKLYGGPSFRCRRCHGLACQSQRECAVARLLAKVTRIRCRLGGSSRLDAPFPPKPKRMRWATYQQLRDEAEQAVATALRLSA